MILINHYLCTYHTKGGHDPWILEDEEKIFGKNKIDIYDALLHKSDRQFLKILEKIKKLGIYENSIIIFTSDHGIGLGKHLDQASYSRLYNVNVNIPFIIKVPGLLRSKVKNIYSLVDVRTSIEDMLGIKTSEKTHGVSFKNELKMKQIVMSAVFLGLLLILISIQYSVIMV